MKHARKDYNRIQDPLNLIPADEPVMVIRGQDISAPNTLRFWAKEHRRNGGDEDMAILIESFAIEMEDWQKTVAVKVADMPNT
jgi:hypothetical protein